MPKKMITIEQRAVVVCQLNDHDEGRIERNLFGANGESWEALRFCKNKDGQHNRVHLVIGEDKFVELFENAVKNGVFQQQTMDRLKMILERRDPFLEVIGIGADGTLSQNIDEELYSDVEPKARAAKLVENVKDPTLRHTMLEKFWADERKKSQPVQLARRHKIRKRGF